MNCPTCGHHLSDSEIPPEPSEGTWVRDKKGVVFLHHIGGGWSPSGFFPLGKWSAMWEARGPLTICGPWGIEL